MEEQHKELNAVGQGGVDNQSSFESARNHSLRSQESDPDMGKGPISNNNGPSIITKSSSSSLLGTQTSEKQQQPYADGDGDGDGHTNLNNAISSNPTNRNVDEGGESNEQKKSQHLTNNDDAEDAEKYKSPQISPTAEVTENANEDNDGEESKKEAETPHEDGEERKKEAKTPSEDNDGEESKKEAKILSEDGEESEKEAKTPSEDNDDDEIKEEAKSGATEYHEQEGKNTGHDNVVSDKEVDSALKESTKSSASSAPPFLSSAVSMASGKHEELPDQEADGEDGVSPAKEKEHEKKPSSSSGSEGKPWGSSLWIPAIVGGIIAAFIFGKVKFSHRRKQPHSDAL